MARPKGSMGGERRRMLQLWKEELPDFEPVMELAKLTMRAIKRANKHPDDLELESHAANLCDRVAQYKTPRLRAVELDADEDTTLEVRVVKHADKNWVPPEKVISPQPRSHPEALVHPSLPADWTPVEEAITPESEPQEPEGPGPETKASRYPGLSKVFPEGI